MGFALYRRPSEFRERRRDRGDIRERLLLGWRAGSFLDRLALLITTSGGTGFLGLGGALAAGFGMLMWAVIGPGISAWVGLGIVTAAGLWAVGRVERVCGVDDPGEITVDEVAGAWLAGAISGLQGWLLFAPLALFFLFDFLKPYPANIVERRGGAIGVMGDDLAAGLYAGILARAGVLFCGSLAGLW
jgi:phosphatidylglycerophosphatase A